MRLTIIGCTGFLSTAIAKYANQQGWYLRAYGLTPPTVHQYAEFRAINLMEEEMECLEVLNSDMIIYAAGAGIQSSLNENNRMIYRLNTTVPVTICNQLKDFDYKGVFVTFGSVFEMGATTESHFFTEEEILCSMAPAPNDYVISKRMLTRFVEAYTHAAFTHWHFIIPTIYGVGENPNRLIPYTIHSILTHQPLHFTAGVQTRQYVHVSEVPALLDMAFKVKLPSGLYNIEGCETLTVHEIVGKIHQALKAELPDDCFGTLQRSDAAMNYLALDGSKLFNAMHFKAKKKIVDVIDEYIL